jgi:hypothetical protein
VKIQLLAAGFSGWKFIESWTDRGDFGKDLRWGHRFRQNLKRVALLAGRFQQFLVVGVA